MQQGSVFFFTIEEEHPWVILSDPSASAESVLLVNLTSWRADKEQTCVIERGEHACLTRKSCVYYEGWTITSLQALLAAKDGGVLRLQPDPMPADVLRRMLDGAARSDNLSTGAQALLRQQRLID
jgi:hypothetical protein